MRVKNILYRCHSGIRYEGIAAAVTFITISATYGTQSLAVVLTQNLHWQTHCQLIVDQKIAVKLVTV